MVEDGTILFKNQMYLLYSPNGQVNTIFLKYESIRLKNWLLWETFNFFLLFSPIDEAGSSILSQGAAGVTVLSIGDGLSASKESEDNNDESAKL